MLTVCKSFVIAKPRMSLVDLRIELAKQGSRAANEGKLYLACSTALQLE